VFSNLRLAAWPSNARVCECYRCMLLPSFHQLATVNVDLLSMDSCCWCGDRDIELDENDMFTMTQLPI
jgi:hypothetical protein